MEKNDDILKKLENLLRNSANLENFEEFSDLFDEIMEENSEEPDKFDDENDHYFVEHRDKLVDFFEKHPEKAELASEEQIQQLIIYLSQMNSYMKNLEIMTKPSENEEDDAYESLASFDPEYYADKVTCFDDMPIEYLQLYGKIFESEIDDSAENIQ